VLIEQAKGVLTERTGISVDEAFTMLRRESRDSNTPIRVVAERVVAGDLAITVPASERAARPPAGRADRSVGPAGSRPTR
jgi:hypothetical protein